MSQSTPDPEALPHIKIIAAVSYSTLSSVQLAVARRTMTGTLAALDRIGLVARELARVVVPFGPVTLARAVLLEARGFVAPRQRHEELVVVEGRREG